MTHSLLAIPLLLLLERIAHKVGPSVAVSIYGISTA